jgi:hypothetical protein
MTDDQVKKRMEQFDKNLPADQRNPNAKEIFDRTIERASQPVQASSETPAQSADYNDKRTRPHKSEDTSG